MKLILGSSSASRQKVLKSMGYAFDVIKPCIDEKTIRHPNPRELTLMLARAKADAVQAKLTEPAVIITSDQVVAFNGKIMEKPESEAEASEYLQNAHLPATTVTSVVVTNTETGKRVEGIDLVTVTMKPFPPELIEAYLKKGEWSQMAGGFDIEDPMIKPYLLPFKGEVESVLGLPKTLTKRLLVEVGYEKM